MIKTNQKRELLRSEHVTFGDMHKEKWVVKGFVHKDRHGTKLACVGNAVNGVLLSQEELEDILQIMKDTP